jgi:hypothetical protein
LVETVILQTDDPFDYTGKLRIVNGETVQSPILSMSISIHSRSRRLTVVVCLLSGLLVGNVSVRYLFGTLFGFVKYRGLAPIAPWVVLLLYLVVLIGWQCG